MSSKVMLSRIITTLWILASCHKIFFCSLVTWASFCQPQTHPYSLLILTRRMPFSKENRNNTVKTNWQIFFYIQHFPVKLQQLRFVILSIISMSYADFYPLLFTSTWISSFLWTFSLQIHITCCKSCKSIEIIWNPYIILHSDTSLGGEADLQREESDAEHLFVLSSCLTRV